MTSNGAQTQTPGNMGNLGMGAGLGMGNGELNLNQLLTFMFMKNDKPIEWNQLLNVIFLIPFIDYIAKKIPIIVAWIHEIITKNVIVTGIKTRLDSIGENFRYVYSAQTLDYSRLEDYIYSKFDVKQVSFNDGKNKPVFTEFKHKVGEVFIKKENDTFILESLNKQSISKFVQAVADWDLEKTTSTKSDTVKVFSNQGMQFKEETTITCNKTLHNIFLSRENEKLVRMLRKFVEHPEEYKRLGVPHKLGVLMYGEPGCGKSSTVYAIANYYGKKLYKLNLRTIESENDFYILRGGIKPGSVVIFEDADCFKFLHPREKQKQSIDYLDESIEQFATKMYEFSTEKGDFQTTNYNLNVKAEPQTVISGKQIIGNITKYIEKEVDKMVEHPNLNRLKSYMTTYAKKEPKLSLDSFLEFLDGYKDLRDCIIIMTTNHPEMLDKAVIRHGRMDVHLEFKYCDSYQFNNMFKFFTGKDVKEIDAEFKFPDNVYSTAEVMNDIIMPEYDEPIKVIDRLKREVFAREQVKQTKMTLEDTVA